MGKQSARIFFNGKDHKEIYMNRKYHDELHESNNLLWEKLKTSDNEDGVEELDYFSVRVVDYMADYETGEMPSGGQGGYVEFYIDGRFTTDWGDGTVTQNQASHVYPTSNGSQYVVKISGLISEFKANTVYKNKVCACVTEILTPIKRGMSVSYYEEGKGQIPSFNAMFSYCKLLKSIPSNLFSEVNDFENVNCAGMFQHCGLEKIPSGLFIGTKNWLINGIFVCNNSLTTIQYGVFSGVEFNKFAGNGIISNCSNLRFVYDYPAGVGVGLSGTSIETFDCYLYDYTSASGLFSGLATLKTISNKLFQYCPEVTSFERCFEGCTSLTEIPVGLFDGLEKVENYDYCFSGCNKLDSIPEDLFEDSYSANSFLQCFLGCTSLTSIPLRLFDSCKYDSEFSGAFMGCSNVTSSAPDLWNYTEKGVDCYNGCYNASNFDDIPDDWK